MGRQKVPRYWVARAKIFGLKIFSIFEKSSVFFQKLKFWGTDFSLKITPLSANFSIFEKLRGNFFSGREGVRLISVRVFETHLPQTCSYFYLILGVKTSVGEGGKLIFEAHF